MNARWIVGFLAAGLLLTAGAAEAAITIDTVPVGNPGNAPDARYATPGFGGVGYEYRIGKYEVTAGEYTEFLNKVAATDAYGLYNTDMSRTDYGSGITQSGSSGSYTYSVATDFANRPVNYVSFWDACRFANWLSNNQPIGAQGPGTTETGAYTLTPDGITNNTVTRNANWTWAVTSEDEWYKAAYYDPNKPGGAGYWDYPTSSDTAPGRDMSEATNPGNNANNYTASGPGPYPIDNGKYTTLAGEFELSDSPYGTFDQGGNVWEWNESIYDESFRSNRGGSFFGSEVHLRAAHRGASDPTYEDRDVGFRVSVPEPATLSLLVLGCTAMLRRRRKS